MSGTTDGAGDLADLADELDRRLAADDAVLAAAYPGQRAERQPVHTVYVPADRFDAETVASWGAQAREALAPYSSTELAQVLDLPVEIWYYDQTRFVATVNTPRPVTKVQLWTGGWVKDYNASNDAATAAP